MSNEKELKHPSYGMAVFHRVHHGKGARLFGSSLNAHYTTVRLTLKHGVWHHDLHEDRYYGSNEIIEVEFSAAQFAELLTNMNVGSGVPCTILYQENIGRIEDPPEVYTEVQRVKASFKDDLAGMVEKMKAYAKRVNESTTKLSEKAKGDIQLSLKCMIQELESNVPFIMEQFNEASDRVVTAAKHEIESFAMHVVTTTGVQALKMPDAQTKRLTESVDSDKKE